MFATYSGSFISSLGGLAISGSLLVEVHTSNRGESTIRTVRYVPKTHKAANHTGLRLHRRSAPLQDLLGRIDLGCEHGASGRVVRRECAAPPGVKGPSTHFYPQAPQLETALPYLPVYSMYRSIPIEVSRSTKPPQRHPNPTTYCRIHFVRIFVVPVPALARSDLVAFKHPPPDLDALFLTTKKS